MSKVIKLKKGLDIKLNGEAEKVVQPAGKITSCALKPTDFRAMTVSARPARHTLYSSHHSPFLIQAATASLQISHRYKLPLRE